MPDRPVADHLACLRADELDLPGQRMQVRGQPGCEQIARFVTHGQRVCLGLLQLALSARSICAGPEMFVW